MKIKKGMNKIRYFAVFHGAKIFWKQTFPTQKIQKFTASVLQQKKWNVDRPDEFVKVSNREILVNF